jgi:hypothetical protein
MLLRNCIVLLLTLEGVIPLVGSAQSPARTGAGPSLADRITQEADAAQRLTVLEEGLTASPYRYTDPQRYAEEVDAALTAFRQRDVPERPGTRLAEGKYALAALAGGDRVSIGTALRLALQLRIETGLVPYGGDDTRTKLSALFGVWRRVEQETRAGFDFSDVPTENVSVPHSGMRSGEVRVSGMDPIYITDARARAEYEAAIERNRSKAAEYNRQLTLRRMRAPFIRHIEGSISTAIRSGAVTEAELTSELSLVQDEGVRNEVLAKIRSLRR